MSSAPWGVPAEQVAAGYRRSGRALMAIPLQTKLFWAALNRLGGTSIMQLPPDQIRAASERRKRLIDLPGAAAIVGRAHTRTS